MENPVVLGGFIDAIGTVLAALIVGVFGAFIGGRYAAQRDRQDKESQWRQHAIALTKFDLERKIQTRTTQDPLRPSILDFLANYRDLLELDHAMPQELYARILKKRIVKDTEGDETRPE